VRRAGAIVGLLALPAVLVAAASEKVTPANGPSLVARLKTGVDWTAFGRAGETDATAVSRAEEGAHRAAASGWLVNGFELTGADLYRINCRSCHGPAAQGSHSGIPPLVGALETSLPGEPVAEVRVRHRLVDGGRVMPPFSHLEGEEVNLLLGHLRSLSGKVKSPDTTIHQSAPRLGEHIVKATCQVCHDAVPGPTRQPADAAVITLSQMTERFSVAEFVHKVRFGSPDLTARSKGRMPRFDYLAPEELEAAYVYLVGFPPEAEKP